MWSGRSTSELILLTPCFLNCKPFRGCTHIGDRLARPTTAGATAHRGGFLLKKNRTSIAPASFPPLPYHCSTDSTIYALPMSIVAVRHFALWVCFAVCCLSLDLLWYYWIPKSPLPLYAATSSPVCLACRPLRSNKGPRPSLRYLPW